MAYENVTPPALPSYDTAANPYYVLVFNYGEEEADWYQVHLYYSATAFTYNGGSATNTGTFDDNGYPIAIDEVTITWGVMRHETSKNVGACGHGVYGHEPMHRMLG